MQYVYLVLMALLAGALVSWLDRKITARLQWRSGPPWYQTFADILKLMGKEIILPENANLLLFIGAPIVSFSAALLSTLIVALAVNNVNFAGEIILLLYLLTLPSLAMVLGASSSGNPLSSLGASRETKLIMAYELPFILVVLAQVSKAHSLLLSPIGQAYLGLSGIIGFIVALLAVQAKLGFVPFDISEAEQEIMAGSMLEYSGPLLAIFKLSKLLLLFTLPIFLAIIFLGSSWLVAKYLLIIILMVLIKNTNPRLRIDHAIKFFWGPVFVLAVIAALLSMVRL